jgi:hypothetical protein
VYSPRIDPGFIPALYQLAKAKGTPMTKLVNAIIREWLSRQDREKSA